MEIQGLKILSENSYTVMWEIILEDEKWEITQMSITNSYLGTVSITEYYGIMVNMTRNNTSLEWS